MNVKLTSSVHTTHDGPTLPREGLARSRLRWRESGSAARRGAATSLRRADRGVSAPVKKARV